MVASCSITYLILGFESTFLLMECYSLSSHKVMNRWCISSFRREQILILQGMYLVKKMRILTLASLYSDSSLHSSGDTPL